MSFRPEPMKLKVVDSKGRRTVIDVFPPAQLSEGRIRCVSGVVHLFSPDGCYEGIEEIQPVASSSKPDLGAKLLFRKNEAAAALSISVRTLETRIACAEIRVIRKGGRTLVHRDELLAAIRRQGTGLSRWQQRLTERERGGAL